MESNVRTLTAQRARSSAGIFLSGALSGATRQRLPMPDTHTNSAHPACTPTGQALAQAQRLRHCAGKAAAVSTCAVGAFRARR